MITISVNEGVDIERLRIKRTKYLSPYRRPSALTNICEENSRSSNNDKSRSRSEKYNNKGKAESPSATSANLTGVASKVPPPAMSPSRPQQTFYFGQNQEQGGADETERKQSAVDKVRSLLCRHQACATLMGFNFLTSTKCNNQYNA